MPRQDREAAERIASAETQLKRLAVERQALQVEADKVLAQGKAYEAAAAVAEKTRKGTGGGQSQEQRRQRPPAGAPAHAIRVPGSN